MHPYTRATVLVALAVSLCILLLSCRQDDGGISATSSSFVRPHFTLGTRFVYTYSRLSLFGVPIPSTRTISAWRITDTAAVVGGIGGSIVVVDSLVDPRTSRILKDTLYFRVTPEGDFYQYGFISRAAKNLYGQRVAPQWDLLAAFSLGMGGAWLVGSLDAAGNNQVTGTFQSGEDYFTVRVDQQQIIYRAFGVQLNSNDFEFVFWIADAPSSLPYLRQESSPDSSGYLRELTTIQSGP